VLRGEAGVGKTALLPEFAGFTKGRRNLSEVDSQRGLSCHAHRRCGQRPVPGLPVHLALTMKTGI
jgi:hypothetical protein